jgi:hypothetical protein
MPQPKVATQTQAAAQVKASVPPISGGIPADIPADLHCHISKHPGGWLLDIKPAPKQLKALKSAGYKAKRIKGQWVWCRP